jgi:hypothetical protein
MAVTTAALAALAATLAVPAPAQAQPPVTDIGIANGTVVNGPVVIRPTVTGGADIKRIQLTALAGSFGDVSSSAYAAPWEIRWDPLYFLDEDVTLYLDVYDSAGATTRTAPVTVYVDRWGPQVTIGDATIYGHASVHQPIAVKAADRAGLKQIELYQNGKLIRTDTTLADKLSGSIGLPLDPATGNGPATLKVRVYDTFGNVTNNDFAVVVDNDRPTGTVSPSGAYLRGTFTASVTGVRDASGLGSLTSYLDNRKGVATTRQAPWSVRVNSRAVPDGKHSLSFDFADLAGNRSLVARTVYVDNTAPSISFSKAPKNKAKLSGKVTLKAKAGDRYGVSKVQLLVNGKVAATDTKAGYAFTLNPKKYGKTFSVQLRAYDKAGNVKYSSKRTYRR